METEKMIWGNPEMDVQQFEPQEYCGACMDAGGMYQHSAKCMNRTNALVFYDDGDGIISDTENNSVYQSGLINGAFHGGCGRTHTWKDNSPTIEFNAVVVLHSGNWQDYVYSNDNRVYHLKSDYVNTPAHISTDSEHGGQDGLVQAFVRPWTGSDHYWIVSIDPDTFKTMS